MVSKGNIAGVTSQVDSMIAAAGSYKFGMRIGENAGNGGGECLNDHLASPVDDLLRKWLIPVVSRFRSSARDYGDDNFHTADALGAKGQFAEIWRKVGKLKLAMWDGKKLERESPQEILDDLIAHCLLAKQFLFEQAEAKKVPPTGFLTSPFGVDSYRSSLAGQAVKPDPYGYGQDQSL